jgi:hypothetical protein
MLNPKTSLWRKIHREAIQLRKYIADNIEVEGIDNIMLQS